VCVCDLSTSYRDCRESIFREVGVTGGGGAEVAGAHREEA
jgi:hypothetical protein